MRSLIVAALILFSPAMTGKAHAVCEQLGGPLFLENPVFGDRFDIWANCIRNNFIKLSTATGALGTTPIRSTATFIFEQTTSDVGWASVDGSSLVLVSSASQFIEINFNCNIECDDNTRCPYAFSYLVDGGFFDGGTASTTTGIKLAETSVSLNKVPGPLNITHQTSLKLSPGTHNISLLWSSGGGVPIRMGRGMRACSLRYREAPEQLGNIGAATVNELGAQSTVNLQILACDVLPCTAEGTTGLKCTWTAQSTTPGDWLNNCNGLTPFD